MGIYCRVKIEVIYNRQSFIMILMQFKMRFVIFLKYYFVFNPILLYPGDHVNSGDAQYWHTSRMKVRLYYIICKKKAIVGICT